MSTDTIAIDDPDRYRAASAAVTAEATHAQAEVDALAATTAAADSATLNDPGDDLGGDGVIAAHAAFCAALAATVTSARDQVAGAASGFAGTGPALIELQTGLDGIAESGADAVESTGR